MTGDFTYGNDRTYVGSGRRIEPDPAGSRIADRYEVLRLLGQGGMGAVYECLDHRLHRRVAIKRMILDSDAALERFQREARAIAALSHPGIVTVWDFDRDAKGPFLVMELLEGQDLHTRVAKEGPSRQRRCSASWRTRAKRCTTRTAMGSSTGTSSRRTCSC